MTDITINIKTGSENSEPKVTTTTDNIATADPGTETPKAETPNVETNEETISEKDTPGIDDPRKMDMIKEKGAKMGSKK